jgi:hypothetical protein
LLFGFSIFSRGSAERLPLICINSGQSNFEFEYIGEFETEFKTILEYESGARVGLIGSKKQRAKISCYCPFKAIFKSSLYELWPKSAE